jgi:hypothetical protein
MTVRSFKLGVMVAVSVAAGVFAGCSSSSSPAPGATTDGGGTGGTDSGGVVNAACTSTTDFDVLFSPMYSAWDGTNTYKIPAIIDGLTPAQMNNYSWSASPAGLATIAPNGDTTTGGVLITTTGSGTVTITAQLNGSTSCGTSTLNISAAQAAQYTAGANRYNNGWEAGVPDAKGIARFIGDQGQACANCHTAAGAIPVDGGRPSLFVDISHTPQQTGGFTDEELMGIFQAGQVPEGGTLIDIADPDSGMTISQAEWSSFHQWKFQNSDEAQGVLWYLRGLAPAPQSGDVNFPKRGDGGFREGGFGEGGRPEGGFGPPPGADAGAGG